MIMAVLTVAKIDKGQWSEESRHNELLIL